MLKDTKTIIFLWNDDQALAFTRYLNRAYLPGTATLDGARIEISQNIPESRMEDHLFTYNHEDVEGRCPIIASDLTYRYVDAPFLDIRLGASANDKLFRATFPVLHQRNHQNGYKAPAPEAYRLSHITPAVRWIS